MSPSQGNSIDIYGNGEWIIKKDGQWTCHKCIFIGTPALVRTTIAEIQEETGGILVNSSFI